MQTAIRWFAHNPVAANLLMVLLLLGGAFGALSTNQEEFPNFDIKAVTSPCLILALLLWKWKKPFASA